MDSNKKLIAKLGALLTGVLLFLTFFSSTIYSLNLAGVTLGAPSEGLITRTARAEGAVDFNESIYMYADSAGKLTLLVSAGEPVASGDQLYLIRSDMIDLQDRLQSEQNRLEKVLINQEKTEAELAYQQNKLDTLTPSPSQVTETTAPDIAQYDYEAVRLTAEITNAEADVEAKRLLLAVGAASRGDVAELENKLESLRLELTRNEERREKAISDFEKAREKAAADDRQHNLEQQRAFESEKKAIAKNMDELKYQLTTLALDEAEARQAADRLAAQINAGGVDTVRAEYSGVISDIPAGVESGAYVEQNKPVMRIGLTETAGYPYKASFSFSGNTDFLELGQEIKISIKSSRLYGLPAVVDSLRYANGRLHAEVLFNADGLNGGEKAEATVEKISELYGQVLPNSAVRTDDEGTYVLYTERVRNTVLGYAYYARRIPIIIFEQDDKNTAFAFFSEITEPVIINSDRPVDKNDRIRPVGGDDIIETR